MPYKIVKRNNQYWVYKTTEDGDLVTRKHADGYATRADALPYLRALYAAERKTASEQIAEMTDDAFTRTRDEVYAKYHDTVNMSASQLEAWANTDASKRASVDRTPITRNLRLLRTPKAEWTRADVAAANRTISFVSRMRGMPKGKPVNQDIPYSKRDIALMNWAYKP